MIGDWPKYGKIFVLQNSLTIEAALNQAGFCVSKKEGSCFSTGPLRIIVTQNSLLLSHKENRQQPVFFPSKTNLNVNQHYNATIEIIFIIQVPVI